MVSVSVPLKRAHFCELCQVSYTLVLSMCWLMSTGMASYMADAQFTKVAGRSIPKPIKRILLDLTLKMSYSTRVLKYQDQLKISRKIHPKLTTLRTVNMCLISQIERNG